MRRDAGSTATWFVALVTLALVSTMGFYGGPTTSGRTCNRTSYSIAQTQADRLQDACADIEQRMSSYKSEMDVLSAQLAGINARLTRDDRPRGKAAISVRGAAQHLRTRLSDMRKVVARDDEMSKMACGTLLPNALTRVEQLKTICEM